MNLWMTVVEILIVYAVPVIASSWLAKRRGRAPGPWILLALALGPIGLFVLVFLPPASTATPNRR